MRKPTVGTALSKDDIGSAHQPQHSLSLEHDEYQTKTRPVLISTAEPWDSPTSRATDFCNGVMPQEQRLPLQYCRCQGIRFLLEYRPTALGSSKGPTEESHRQVSPVLLLAQPASCPYITSISSTENGLTVEVAEHLRISYRLLCLLECLSMLLCPLVLLERPFAHSSRQLAKQVGVITEMRNGVSEEVSTAEK